MNREANLNLHIKNLDERMHQNEDKIMDDEKLTPDDIIAIRLKQNELQNCLIWLTNIRKSKFPSKILMNGKQN